MPPPQDTSPAAPASTLPDRPPAAAVPPSVAQTCAAPPGCLSECRAHPRAGPLAATPAADKPLAVGVVAGDRFAPVPTVHDVVHGPGVLNPKFARHTVPCGRIRSGRPGVKPKLMNSRD